MALCTKCRQELTYNEIGASKKFIMRDTRDFFCKACLANRFSISVADIDRKIIQFKEQGCTLFL
mgnify:CR=1 FL=1